MSTRNKGYIQPESVILMAFFVSVLLIAPQIIKLSTPTTHNSFDGYKNVTIYVDGAAEINTLTKQLVECEVANHVFKNIDKVVCEAPEPQRSNLYMFLIGVALGAYLMHTDTKYNKGGKKK